MKNLCKYLLMLMAGIPVLGYTQAEGIVGDIMFDNFEYEEAIHYYLRADELSLNQEENMAYAYYSIHDYENAVDRYKIIIDRGEDIDPIFYYFYGNALKNTEQFEEANKFLNIALSMDSSQHYVKNALRSIDVLKSERTKAPTKEIVKLETINNGASTYSPFWYKNGIAFCSEFKIDSAKRRPMVDVGGATNVDKLHYGLSERPLSEIFYMEVDEDLNVTKSELIAKSDKFHISSFSIDENEIYFTKIDVVHAWDPSLRKHPRLFKGTLNSSDKVIEEDKRLPIKKLSNEVGAGHPVLYADGTKIYFCSDKPGGFGGSDLYVSTLEESGKWSEPENLGAQINSPGDELYPTINNNSLYYSSDGLPGYGGLDIFSVSLKEINNAKPHLLQAPINSVADDFGLLIYPTDTNKGFVSSNRYGGFGDDDLYAFKLKEPDLLVQGTVYDASGNPASGVTVVIYDEEGNQVGMAVTDENGNYAYELSEQGTYKIVATTPGYGDQTNLTLDNNYSSQNATNLNLVPAATAQGQILNPDGSFAAGVEVALLDDNGNVIYRAVTDANGNYSFLLDENNTYTITATDGELTGSKTIITDENYDSLKDTNITLGNGGTYVEGTLLNEDGTVASGVEVLLYDDQGNIVSRTTTDEDGNFRFDLDRDKNYQVVAMKDGFEGVANIFTGDNYNERDKLQLKLSPAGKETYALVKDSKSNEPIANVVVVIEDQKSGLKTTVRTDEDGKFEARLKNNTDYIINLSKDGYYPKSLNVNIGKDDLNNIDLSAKDNYDLDYAGYNVQRIYYDYNKSKLTPESEAQLNKIVEVMKANPKSSITITSYADCRGRSTYNVSLSWKRSRAVKTYLIENGIASKRILTKSLGATNFVNNCITPDACTEEEHALNRRSEFQIDFD